jgi:Icc protein
MRLIQLTDCHLFDDPATRLGGVDTQATLAAVIDALASADPAPDVVLATGDLTQLGEAGAYGRVRRLLQSLAMPVYCLPGNHDHRETFAAAMPGDGVHVTRSLCRDGWQILFLDSTIPGEDDGRLGEAELAALDQALAARPDHHALVCLHHHPVVVGGAWRDVVSLENPDRLFAIIDRHPGVRGILFGHIHQAFDSERNGVKLMGTPSTCFQFVDDDGSLGIGGDPPGYRRLALAPDGSIESTVHWVGARADFILPASAV